MRGFFKKLYAGWMRFAHRLGVINTAILLTIVYVVGIGPMWLVTRLFRDDALGDREAPSYWKSREKRPGARPMSERERMRFQF